VKASKLFLAVILAVILVSIAAPCFAWDPTWAKQNIKNDLTRSTQGWQKAGSYASAGAYRVYQTATFQTYQPNNTAKWLGKQAGW
jgi:hypothetical protein